MMRRLAVTSCVLVLTIATALAQPAPYPTTAPPSPPREVIPPVPANHTTWVWRGGYFRWSAGSYVWVPGAYAAPPRPGYRWFPGHWRDTSHGWVWVEGRWR